MKNDNNAQTETTMDALADTRFYGAGRETDPIVNGDDDDDLNEDDITPEDIEEMDEDFGEGSEVMGQD